MTEKEWKYPCPRVDEWGCCEGGQDHFPREEDGYAIELQEDWETSRNEDNDVWLPEAALPGKVTRKVWDCGSWVVKS